MIKNWCYQYVSILELRAGLFQDAELNRQVAREQTTPSGWLLARACGLAKRQQILQHLTQLRQNLISMAVVLLVLGLFVGASAGMTALGSSAQPVNVIWSLLGLLLMPTVTLMLWLLSLTLQAVSPPWFGRVWQSISTWVMSKSSLLDAWHAWLELARQAGVLKLWMALISHLLWLSLLSGSVIAMIAAFSLKHYTFVWETTWLSVDVFVQLTSVIAGLSEWLGLSMPDTASIVASGNYAIDEPSVRMHWANWLVGSVFVLGILPRLLALVACSVVIWSRYRYRQPDPSTSYAKAVLSQIRHDSAMRTSDGPPGAKDLWTPLRSKAAQTLNAGETAVVGLELLRMPAWAQQLPNLGVVDDRETRARALERLGAQKPVRLVIVADAGQTPDRGSMSFARELAAMVGQTRVVLEPRPNGPDRSSLWTSKLIESGMEPPLKDHQQATQWLNAGLP